MFYLHLKSVFDLAYCQSLIAAGNDRGFKSAAVNVYGEDKMRTDIRNNSRVIWDDEILARELEDQIKKIAGDKFPVKFGKNPQIWIEHNLVGFGSHFRMYKYSPSEYFKPHKDGRNKQADSESLITVLVYLNNTDGGETVLMPNGFADKSSWIKISPRAGDVLMFQHDCWHEGKPVNSGEKYVLRTDIFYSVA